MSREHTTEHDVLLDLFGKLSAASAERQKEILDREIRTAPSMFRDVWEAIRRVHARVARDKVTPAIACERELRLLRGVDPA